MIWMSNDDVAAGPPSNTRLLATLDEPRGGPDWVGLDRDGFLW